MDIDKKQLIGFVNEIGKNIDPAKAIKNDLDRNDKSIGVGTNQFRNLASMCKNSEIYEEIELLVKYKIAKDKSGFGWKTISGKGKKQFGKVVLNEMRKIRAAYDDETVLQALSLFFGYLYQSSRVWKDEVTTKNSFTKNNNAARGGNR